VTADSMSCPIGLGQYPYWPDCYEDTVVAFCKSEANEPIRAVLQPAELYVPLLGSRGHSSERKKLHAKDWARPR
jgi:hypothetical protein